jgi:anionic cell wall polymer biosynthesis LytR-Cps2A-Psr (LCP) family protein
VLEKLLQKVKGLDAMQVAALAADMLDQVRTNLPLDDLLKIALQVCSNGISGVKSIRLPVSGSYKEEVRNEQSMLYDCDFQTNALELYNFIYQG